MSPDSELVGAYVTEGSETAFRILVSRYANLVYSTALRQVGDSGLAEEITQNVFVALAKKAPRLAGVETLTGWLHRTAILESKARIRSELRRRTREQTAAVLTEVDRQEDASLEAMVLLVDEALLGLRETDRLALVLRYFENRSLREVGGALGVDEEAARKRVSRALIRVMDFFQHRGFTLPVGIGMAAVLTGTAKAAPTGLVTAATSSGLAAGKTITGFNILLFQLMSMGTKKAVVGCVLLAAAPLVWQSHLQARFANEHRALQAQSTAASSALRAIESSVRELRESVSLVEQDVHNTQARLATMNAQRNGIVQPPRYEWDDSSPYMRVPKQLLAILPQGVDLRNDTIELQETATEFLQMTENERLQTQAAMQKFFDGYLDEVARKMRRVEPTKKELRRRKPEEVRIYEVDDLTEEVKRLRAILFAELETILGRERFPHFRNTLADWMPVDDEDRGMNSGNAVVTFPHRRGFYMPSPGSLSIGSSISRGNRGSISGPMELDNIPRIFASDLQDWVVLARSQAPAVKGVEP